MMNSDKELLKNDNEKSKVTFQTEKKKKKWKWIVGILLVGYIISKIFDLDSSFDGDDMISLIGRDVSDIEKLYGEGKVYDAINAVSYSNGLAVNYYSNDNMKIVYVSIESPNSGRLCNLSIGDYIDTVTEEMNKLDAKLVVEEAAAGYSVEERGYRNYSFAYDGRNMICSVIFEGRVVSGISCYENSSKVDLE